MGPQKHIADIHDCGALQAVEIKSEIFQVVLTQC